MNTEIIICVCKHCGYRWIPRSFLKPARCPKCQSRNWEKERKQK